MDYPDDTVQRPRYFGVLTNDIVYDRLAPGVLEERKKANPKDEATEAKAFSVANRQHRIPEAMRTLGISRLDYEAQ
jgi:hypothetical protein